MSEVQLKRAIEFIRTGGSILDIKTKYTVIKSQMESLIKAEKTFKIKNG